MDHPERSESSQELRQWVTACSDLLAPPEDWEPSLSKARVRFEARRDARLRRRSTLRHYFLIGATAALIACIAVPSIPQVSVLAQQFSNSSWRRLEQLWYWITIVRRGPVLLGRMPDLMKSLHTRPLGKPEPPYPVADLSEAAWRAGFTPRLPNSGVLSGSPQLSVHGPMSFATVISAAELTSALRKVGAQDQSVPGEWDGAQLTLQLGALVTARWSNVSEEGSRGTAWSDLTLTQGPMPVVAAPAGFDRAAFAITTLRAAGMRNRDMVLKLAQRATTAPALLFGYLPPHFVGVREVNLHAGPATLIEELGDNDPNHRFAYNEVPRVERVTLLWSRSDRVYMLSGVTGTPTNMLGADFAGALANAIALANSID
jgi:hypothetical protein